MRVREVRQIEPLGCHTIIRNTGIHRRRSVALFRLDFLSPLVTGVVSYQAGLVLAPAIRLLAPHLDIGTPPFAQNGSGQEG